MKVKLEAARGPYKAGSVVDYDDVSGQWLIDHGQAVAVEEKAKAKATDDTADAKPVRRGRPPKGDA